MTVHNTSDKNLQQQILKSNSKNFYCFGFSLWKHSYVRSYLFSPEGSVSFYRSKAKLKKDGIKENAVFIVWGYKDPDWLNEFIRADIPLYRMEDGFLRSTGLGSDINIPASLVIDTKGIYYNPQEPSDLEHLLESKTFSPEILERADNLRRMIVDTKISKYNVDGGDRIDTAAAAGKKVILVPGQVEDDASIKLGTVDIKTNLQLLQAARKNRPDGYIIFKPHPDVVSGNRKGDVSKEQASRLADMVIEDSSISHCLDIADEVHTMTSLVGFEALMRGLKVTAYGRPFYAGWGLTTDMAICERRHKQLSLSELVAGTLIIYPRYMNPLTLNFTTPENIVLNLKAAKDAEGQVKIKTWRPLRQLKRLLKMLKVIIYDK
jgi:capsular polysaccharide export protein